MKAPPDATANKEYDLTCACCAIVADLQPDSELFSIGEHWTLNANVHSSRPSMVLQSREHVGHLEDLEPAARRELGEALPVLVGRLRAATGAERVYSMLINEGEVPHVHWHLVPRFPGELPGPSSKIIAAAPPTRRTRDQNEVAKEVSRKMEPRGEPSKLVRSLLVLLRIVERGSPYRLLPKFKPLSRLPRSSLAEIYVPSWLVLLLILLALSGLHPVLNWIAAVLGAYRLADMMAMHLSTLLQRTRQRLSSYPRSFLLALLNLAELSVIVALGARNIENLPRRTSLLFGFDVVTLRGGYDGPGWALDVVGVAGAVAALIILAGIISIVVGLLAHTFVETRE